MTNIMWWTADASGCGHYRMIYPGTALTKLGYNCHIDNRYPLEKTFDLLVGQRISRPDSSEHWNSTFTSMPRVFEIDDDLWNVHHTSSAYSYYGQRWVKDNLAHNCSTADAVTVTTPHLAEVVAKYNTNVHIIPNFIPESIFDIPKQQTEQLTVGWAGGPTHKIDAEVIQYPLKKILQQEEVVFKCTGWNIGAYMRLPHTYTHWTKNLEEHYERLDFDIGICPLRPGVFNKSKSYIKALEYAARGIPVVASDYGPYQDLKDQDWIRLCRTGPEWLAALREFIHLDDAARKELSNKAIEYAKTQTYEKNIHLWQEAFGI